MKVMLVKNQGKTRTEYLFEKKNGKNVINHRSTRGRSLLFDRTMEVEAEFGNNLYKKLLNQGYTRFTI